MVVHRRKAHQRTLDIALVAEQAATLGVPMAVALAPADLGITDRGAALDPAAGDLNEARAARKRAQIASAAAHALRLLRSGDHVVEFGAGQGHLGLLLASARRDIRVTLVEIKECSCEGARARAAALALTNVRVFCGSVDAFVASTDEPLDCVVGLHCCGLLSDAVLEVAAARRSAVCLVPCCYGQIVGGVDHARGGDTAPCMHPRSAAFRGALSGDGLVAFRSVAKAADLVVGRGGAVDVDSASFATAQACMRLVDTDRLLWLAESAAARGEEPPRVELARLEPPTCSPKSSVLLVARAAGRQLGDAAAAPVHHASASAPAPAAASASALPSTIAGPWLALFGGQGAVGGQMRELRRCASDARVATLLAHLSACLQAELSAWQHSAEGTAPDGARCGSCGPSYEHGLDVHSWVVGPDSRARAPPRGYLEQACRMYLPCTFPVPSLYLPCTFPVPRAGGGGAAADLHLAARLLRLRHAPRCAARRARFPARGGAGP
jgi:hypothetical protein